MMPSINLQIGHQDALLRVECGGVEILRYNDGGGTPPACSPKPFFHPLRTMAGRDVCLSAPEDHPWHAGLWLAFPGVDGVNFWGGPTYVRDRGYVQLENRGVISHLRWKESSAHEAVEELEWRDTKGGILLAETRHIGVAIDLKQRSWTLSLVSQLRNVAGRELCLTSPGSYGRPEGGYAGLSWRGTDDFVEFIGADDAHANGGRFDRLGMQTRDRGVSVLIEQVPADERHPNRWFARSKPYPLLACSPVFDKMFTLARDASLHLQYSLRVSDHPPRLFT